MKRIVLFTALLLGLFVLTPSAPAQVKVPGLKYACGRVAPKNLEFLRRQSDAAHRKMLAGLPKATEATFDCRMLNWVPPVVDQGQCGSCWDFSGTCICTTAYIVAGWYPNDGSFMLSEQYTLDCGSNGGCNGDDNTNVTQWCKTVGLPTTKDYGPYQGSAGSCKYVSSMKLYKLQESGFVDGSGQGVTDTQKIKDAMKKFGPIGCAVAAGGTDFWNTGQGVDVGTSGQINHDVVLVGWDDAKDCGDGSKGAWIMRNSWGTGWGNQGYAWMKYGADSIGTEAIWAQAPPAPNPPAPPGIPVVSTIAATGNVGAPFAYQITATNSPTSYGATGLPPGLTCNVTTGYISGTPTTAVVVGATLTATNAAGTGTGVVQFTITTGPPPPPPLVLGTGSLADGTAFQMVPASATVAPAGSVMISGSMTFREVLDAFDRCQKAKLAPPCNNCPPKADRLDAIEGDVRDLKRGMEAIIKALLPKEMPKGPAKSSLLRRQTNEETAMGYIAFPGSAIFGLRPELQRPRQAARNEERQGLPLR